MSSRQISPSSGRTSGLFGSQGPLAGIEARLDHLSAQMETCLAEVKSWKGHSFAPGGTEQLPTAKAPEPEDDESSADSSPVSASAEGRKSQTEPFMRPSRARLQMKPARSMDLQVAWRLHAKDIGHELTLLSTSDKRIEPLIRLVQRSNKDKVWELLDDPNSSSLAWWVSLILKLLVIACVVISTLESAEQQTWDDTAVAALLASFDAVFLLEFCCRLVCAPSKKSYFADPLNWADMFSALGLPLRICLLLSTSASVDAAFGVMEAVRISLLYFLPLARVLKILRYFESFRLLIDACQNSAEALPVLAYMLTVMVLFSATFIYLVEPRSNVPSLPHSMWLAVVTITTVGYGDYYPTSLAGYLVVSTLTFVSVLFLALPVGIIGHEFTQSWMTRRKVLLQTRTRRCLHKWGYSAVDLQMLFEYADADADGNLTLLEFTELFRQLRIGLSGEAAAELFTMFDSDQNGVLDRAEVLRNLFPEEYVLEKKQLQLEGLDASKDRIKQALECWGSQRSSVLGSLPEDPASQPTAASPAEGPSTARGLVRQSRVSAASFGEVQEEPDFCDVRL